MLEVHFFFRVIFVACMNIAFSDLPNVETKLKHGNWKPINAETRIMKLCCTLRLLLRTLKFTSISVGTMSLICFKNLSSITF